MSFAFASGSGDNETKLQLNGGAAVLQNGHCIVCDYDGKNIKLLHSYETRIKATLALKDNPWDVTAIDGCNVIITFPKVRQLKFIKVIPDMVPGRVIQLDKPCWGIQMARSVDEIYTSCYSDTQGDILVLDMEGNLKRRLEVTEEESCMLQQPCYLGLSKAGFRLLVFDSNRTNFNVACVKLD